MSVVGGTRASSRTGNWKERELWREMQGIRVTIAAPGQATQRAFTLDNDSLV